MTTWLIFLILSISTLCIHGFYSMLEMASISFNRIKLQLYISQNNQRAKWLESLLNHPIRLFGTTLIGVNTAMQFGSECTRRFYISLGFSPEWAPITQIILILIFSELAPMLAARRYSEHVCMIGTPILSFTAYLLRPVLFIISIICQITHKMFNIKPPSDKYLTKEDIQIAIENQALLSSTYLNPILTNIFSLRSQEISTIMTPINTIKCIPFSSTIADLKHLLQRQPLHFIPIYKNTINQIIGITYPRDLIRYSKNTTIEPYSHPPWFIPSTTSILSMISAFQKNTHKIAIVVDKNGLSVGCITLNTIVESLLGSRQDWIHTEPCKTQHPSPIIHRSFQEWECIETINTLLNSELPVKNTDQTIRSFMELHLNKQLEPGDSIKIKGLTLLVKDKELSSKLEILITSTQP